MPGFGHPPGQGPHGSQGGSFAPGRVLAGFEAAARAAPNPFEPRPRDGDRDSTTFAMTSTERGRLRVVVYRHASTRFVRVVIGGQRAAGRQRVGWSGKTSSGASLGRPIFPCHRDHRRRRQRLQVPTSQPPCVVNHKTRIIA